MQTSKKQTLHEERSYYLSRFASFTVTLYSRTARSVIGFPLELTQPVPEGSSGGGGGASSPFFK
jgi:hypothetical protein